MTQKELLEINESRINTAVSMEDTAFQRAQSRIGKS